MAPSTAESSSAAARASSRARRATAFSVALATCAIAAASTAEPAGSPRASLRPPAPTPVAAPASDGTSARTDGPAPLDPMQRLGSISVGHPNAGFLVNGVRMPPGDAWVLSLPDHAWGTDETIESLARALNRVAVELPGGPRAIIGSISAEHGGPLAPHRSHRTGRDVDVHLFLVHRRPGSWYEPGTAENLDLPRCWAFLEALIVDSDLDFVLVDQSVQDLLEAYALAAGRDPSWIADVFDGASGPGSDLIKHVPGHRGHFHVRFVSPFSRRRGVELYDRLVEQSQIEPPIREVRHVVGAGDTLLGLARRYSVSVADIQSLNGLGSSLIRTGQELRITAPVDLPGARDPVIVPRRRLPPVSIGRYEPRCKRSGSC